MKSINAYSKGDDSQIISKEVEVNKHYNNVLSELLNPGVSPSTNKMTIVLTGEPLSATKDSFVPFKYKTGTNFNKQKRGIKHSEGVESMTKMTKDEDSTTAINSTSCEINRTLKTNATKRTQKSIGTRNSAKKNPIVFEKDFPFQRFEIAERKKYGYYDNTQLKTASQKDVTAAPEIGATFQIDSNQERLLVNKRIVLKSNDTTIHKNNKYERPATTNCLLPVKQRHPMMEKRRIIKEK